MFERIKHIETDTKHVVGGYYSVGPNVYAAEIIEVGKTLPGPLIRHLDVPCRTPEEACELIEAKWGMLFP